MRVRYVGGAPGEILDTPYAFKRFGQLAEVPDKLLQDSHLSLLPDSEFSKLGVDQKELDQWGDFRRLPQAPETFKAKVQQAWVLLHNWRNPAPVGPAASEEEPVTNA